MTGKKRKREGEVGAVSIIEASFVFPVMFIVLIFLIYLGNFYFLKAQVESVAEIYAVKGAAYCADPLLGSMESGGAPDLSDLHVKPYRYVAGLFGDDMSGIAGMISDEVTKAINNSSGTFFANMHPVVTNSGNIAKYNNGILYSSFSVNVECRVNFPVRFFNDPSLSSITMRAYAEAPVNDMGEFIRNTDMVIDYFQDIKLPGGQTLGGKVKDIFGKINDFLESFAGK